MAAGGRVAPISKPLPRRALLLALSDELRKQLVLGRLVRDLREPLHHAAKLAPVRQREDLARLLGGEQVVRLEAEERGHELGGVARSHPVFRALGAQRGDHRC